MKLIIVTAPIGYLDTVEAALSQHEITPVWWEPRADHDEIFSVRFLSRENEQKLLDDLEKVVGSSEIASIHTLRIDSSYPSLLTSPAATRLTRDEIHLIAERSSHADPLYLLLVSLSTIVAAIGLLQDNVAVVIGAMVIAPLLGPNLSVTLGMALGESQLVRRATVTLLSGISLAFAISFFVGMIWPDKTAGVELTARTLFGTESAVLALASGAAGVLSLTSGVPAVLVGVMVAVALLPPLATSAILLSWYDVSGGINALVLFVLNVAAINLAAHVTLYLSSIRPRSVVVASRAGRNSFFSATGWFIVIFLLIYLGPLEFSF